MNEPANATILLFCSDPIMRQVLAEVLEAEGYVILQAGDLGRAVDWLARTVPHLLIVRPYVDNHTGHDAALYLRTKCNGLPVLIVGGYLDDDRLDYRSSLRSFEVFPKPFTAPELLEKVREVLRSSSSPPTSKVALREV